MCGRYTLLKLADVLQAMPWLQAPPDLRQRFNIAPSQAVLAVTNEEPPQLGWLQWGLIPEWAKDPSIGNRLINARAETLASKPAFRSAFRSRRCLVPADGFFEWRKEPGGVKTPMYIRLRSQTPFAFAGLWETWRSPQGEMVRTCTLITTPPNELVAPIHNRMPGILRASDYQRWLDPKERDPEALEQMLAPYPAAEMEMFPVSRQVNDPRHDSAGCIQRAEEMAPGLFENV